MGDTLPWLVPALLGAYHGLNPAMGWLFAVGLGLQERRRGAVLQALPPIAMGHAVAVSLTVLVVVVARIVVPLEFLRYAGAGLLILFGLYKLLVRKHPRLVGGRVGFGDLTAWSFLIVPAGAAHGAHGAHADHASTAGSATVLADLAVVGVHTLAMFAVMGLVAIVVYEKLGVTILKRSWFDLDLVWAGALVGAGLITLVV